MMSNDNTAITDLFFALIRCGIGKEDVLPSVPTAEQWKELFDLSKKHTLAGITFAGIERLPQEQRPQKDLLLQWYILRENIKNANVSLNKKVAAVTQKFQKEGFRNCILKGQGIAQLYPAPLLRTPGDIDIWLEGGCDKVVSYIRTIAPECKPTYHHVDFNISNEVDIEVHYRPTWMYSPTMNRRLQKFFSKYEAVQFSNTINTGQEEFNAPTPAFNMVYIPIHIYRHLFSEGIGLRQILDYYYVLMQETGHNEKAECKAMLTSVNLSQFMQSLMCVMQQIFHLDEKHMPFTPDPKGGKFLMHEIMTAGNFGHHDTRYKERGEGYSFALMYNLVKRSFKLIPRHPSEVFWAPLFKIWHFFWRKKFD